VRFEVLVVETVRMGLGHCHHQMLAATDFFETRAAGSKVVHLHHLGNLIQFAILCNNLLNQTIKIIQKTKVNFVQFPQFHSKE